MEGLKKNEGWNNNHHNLYFVYDRVVNKMTAKELQDKLLQVFAIRHSNAEYNKDGAKNKVQSAYYDGCMDSYKDAYNIILTFHI